ncbi:MAG TPA: DUF885 domain-containing protein [Candidatus Dormibacteraeota bacterium]|nr:DUF885 domain-containing protein [Candidatus Dormibacteraeota bacterium]
MPRSEPDPTLAGLATEAWDAYLTANPTVATAIGDRRFDDRLPPNREADEAALHARLVELLDRALAAASRELTEPDRVTASALVQTLSAELARRESGVDAWTVDPLEGPQVAFMALESYQPAATPAEGAAMVARWAAMGPWLDRHVERLRVSLADGLVSPGSPVVRTLAEIEALLASPTEAWPLLRPAASERPGWGPEERSRFADGLLAAAALGLRPALERYRAFLADELLPRARSDDRPGLVHLPGGGEAYASLARSHTSLELSPEEIHAIGLAESERIDAELAELSARVLGTAGLHEALRRLRGDPGLHFSTPEEIVDVARSSLARAVEAVPAWFGTVPQAPCEVVEIPAYEAEHTTIAYYREPAAEGSRPGQFFINATEPTTRPRYEAEALAFHESVPGHHLQIAIAQERPLPAFRRFGGTTAFIEGWGLYSERLADEMGLYSADLDRIGVLSFDGWRASRLVVDTGMHALGWSRAEAIDFMTRHTALASNNIANEVDRYITWPGQALAYKLGQLELLRLRDVARDRLGAAFDIRDFHDTVLHEGALPLRTLARVVEAWLDRAEGAATDPR